MQMYTTACITILVWLAALPGTQAQSWQPQGSGSSGDIWSVDFLDAARGVAAVWVQPGAAEILRTENGGSTWTKAFSDINQGCTGASYPSAARACVVGGTTNFGRVFGSGGGAFQLLLETAEAKPAFWTIDFGDAQTGYTGGGGGALARTTNGGASWAMLGTRVPGNGNVIDLHFIDAQTGFAVASNSIADFVTGRSLYRTTDGGRNWTALQTFFALRAVHFSSPNQGYAVGNRGSGPAVWKSTDGGTSWSVVYTGSGGTSVYLNDVCFTPENPYVGYAVGGDLWDNDQGIIISTTDGGHTWTEELSARPYALRSVDFPTETTGYACGSGGTMLKTLREAREVPKPGIELDHNSLEFGPVELGDTQTQAVHITPANIAGLGIEAIEFTDENAPARGFSLAYSGPLPAQLAFGQSLQVLVSFRPVAAGPVTAGVEIRSNDTEQPRAVFSVAATGMVAPVAEIEVDKAALHFGTIEAGSQTSAELLLSAGSAHGVTVSSATIEGADAVLFTLDSDALLPLTLGESETLVLSVGYAPLSEGEHNTELLIRSNDADEPEIRIPVSGRATKAVSVNESEEPQGWGALLYPNPSGAVCRIQLSLPDAAECRLELLDAAGRLCTVYHYATLPAGIQQLELSTAGLAAGTYFCRIITGSRVRVLPLVISGNAR